MVNNKINPLAESRIICMATGCSDASRSGRELNNEVSVLS